MRKGRRKGEAVTVAGSIFLVSFRKCVRARRGYAIIVIAGIKGGVNAQCGKMRSGVNTVLPVLNENYSRRS